MNIRNQKHILGTKLNLKKINKPKNNQFTLSADLQEEF